ncbi:hypothetical protein [Canibacter oris]|uniref:Uncharacterized protein n=1 Tax=Canibacter oris TaxID=1365628 RepID=A0A840DK44_9MICO|nr:hypothetical protein [Canibacter oris]MBB4072063.1 hypothetical protein [Canibacter oris]
MPVAVVDMTDPRQKRAIRDLSVLAAAIEKYDAVSVAKVLNSCDLQAVLTIAANELNKYRELQQFLDTPVIPAKGCKCHLLHCVWQALENEEGDNRDS